MSRGLLGALAGSVLSVSLAVGAAAQQPVVVGGSGQADVFVNMQVLNSLGPGPAYPPATAGSYGSGYGSYGAPAYGAPPAAYGGYLPQYVTRPGTLLYPPPSPPRSQVTVQLPGTAAQPQLSARPAPQPQVSLSPPATSQPEPAAPKAAPQAPAPETSVTEAPAPETSVTEAPATEAPAAGTEMAERATPPTSAAPAGEAEQPVVPPSPSTEAGQPPAQEAAPAETEAAAPPPPTVPQQARSDEQESQPEAPGPTAVEPTAPTPEAASGGAMSEPEMPSESASVEAETDSSSDLAPPPPPDMPAESESAASDIPAAPQTSALTEGPEDGLLRLDFPQGSADLSEAAKESLRNLAQALLEDSNARVQLLAYASSAEDSASRARRLSLSRALAVRAYLIDQGVRSTRMDVRALGNKAGDGPPDRVDILPARR